MFHVATSIIRSCVLLARPRNDQAIGNNLSNSYLNPIILHNLIFSTRLDFSAFDNNPLENPCHYWDIFQFFQNDMPNSFPLSIRIFVSCHNIPAHVPNAVIFYIRLFFVLPDGCHSTIPASSWIFSHPAQYLHQPRKVR